MNPRIVMGWLRGWGLGAAAALMLVPASRAQSNAPAAAPDFAAFKIVTERNIFDAKRTGRSSRGGGERRRVARVDTVALVGTLSYEKGNYAFFDGSSSEYRKALQSGATIAGYTLAEVLPNRVKLTQANASNAPVELKVGLQLRREDGGDWQVTARSSSTERSSGGPPSTGPDLGRSRRSGERSGDSGNDRAPEGDTRVAEGGGEMSEARPEIDGAEEPEDRGGGDVSEILRRLMEQREKEIK
jgi:hypothetical protein